MAFLKKKKQQEVKEQEEVETPNPPKEENELAWSVKEVPIQYQERYYNSETEEVLDINETLVRILNDLDEIKKFLSE